MTDKATVVAVFKTVSRKNKLKSKKEGRPIFDDVEACEIRFSGDRNRVTVVPAHSVWKHEAGEPITYAMRWSEQYKRFKAGQQQSQDGTPIEELPFLSQSKRLELKALSIYTAEALASLEGNQLKSLGIGGRELKNQAQAYIDNATGSAKVTAMAAEIEALKQTIADLQTDKRKPKDEAPAEDGGDDPQSGDFEDWSDEDLKAWIKEETGSAPRGNPSHATLVNMATEASRKAA